jgi:hypothetical protein
MAESTTTQATEGTTTTQATEGTDNSKEGTKGFTPITTQDQYDAVAARIRKEEAARYEGYSDYKQAAERLQEIEDADKSELDKLKERAEAAEAKARAYEQAAQIDAWRQEVSKKTGVAAELLRGTTKEELQEHAEALAGYVKPSAAPHIESDGKQSTAPPGSTAASFANAIEGTL